MVPQHAGQGSLLARSILRHLIGFACVVVLVIAIVAAAHGVAAGRDGAAAPGLLVAGLGLAGLLMIVVAGLQVARSIARPIQSLAQTLQAIAAGKLDAANAERHRPDEIGDSARAADVFRAQAIELQRLTSQKADAERTASADRRKALNAMAETIERETSIVLATLADHARSGIAAGDVDRVLRLVREGVGRAVRTANSAVERRRWPRIALSGSASIQIDGTAVAAPIIDVSAGGLRLGSAIAGRAGQRCRVSLPGVTPELPAEILAVSESETRLRFDIDDITRSVINEMLATRSGARASAA